MLEIVVFRDPETSSGSLTKYSRNIPNQKTKPSNNEKPQLLTALQ